MKEENAIDNTGFVTEKNKFIAWVKEHKEELILAGVSFGTVLATILLIRNKNDIIKLWNQFNDQIEKSKISIIKLLSPPSIEELNIKRNQYLQNYLNKELDYETREYYRTLMFKIDKKISEIQWAGEEYGFPVHRSNGWYLPDA